ncbi:MAG TPA: PLP-dependent aminotransferase family protein [Geminicoccaceae bacterium]|nr:PLP-dependent aminotransferase family protein [Geminicoccaceae bacterium]
MTSWLPDLAPWPGARYAALAEAIAQDVAAGTLPAGARLPPQRDLAYRLGVTVGTVSRAYAVAAQRGLVTGEVGRGTYVRPRPPPSERPDRFGDGGDALITLTVNAPPDPSYRTLLAQALGEIGARAGALDDFLSYTPKRGFADHRVAAAAWIGRVGLAVSPEQIVITGGAHQAIVTALAALARPGDEVMVEALTYAGVCHIAERLGLRLHGLAIDEEGLRPDALEEAARGGRARLLFVNPTAHNPTTATMSQRRREAIVALARRHDLILIEDDVYGQLPEERPPPLAALAPERTVHVSSASKSIAPGLRLGILASPAALGQRIAEAQHDLFLTCPPLLAEVFRHWVASGTADRLARQQRLEAAARQALARELLGVHRYQAQPTSYHLWLPLPPPWRTAEFTAAVRERGVAIDPGSSFAVDPATAPHAVRVSLSAAAGRERLARALGVLARTLDEAPARRREVI